MANQSSLRPTLAYLLQQYAQLLQTAPKYARVIAAAALCTALGALYERNRRARARAEQRVGRGLVRRNSEVKLNDGTRVIYVPYKTKTTKVTLRPTKPTTFDAHRRLFLEPPGGRDFAKKRGAALDDVPPPNTKPGLNLAFLHQLFSLLTIMIPRMTSKECFFLFLHACLLVSRTYLSLVVARLDGEIVRDLVAGNGKAFTIGILKWLGVGGPAVYCNAMIKYIQAKISIAFRTRLTRYIHDLYLNDSLSYYKVHNLDGGLTGGGVDQFVTTDLAEFCDQAASLYSSIGKPFLDLVVFNYQLYRSLGPLAFSGIMINYIGSAWMLRKLSPPFGKLKATELRREGEFHSLHTRLIANAEEIAFYGGSNMERNFLDRGFKELKTLMEGIYGMKIRYSMLEDFVIKYSWSALGYVAASLPTFLPAWGGQGGAAQLITAAGEREGTRMKAFVTNKRLMLSLADAGGRLMLSMKDLAALAGHTSRVYTLVSTLHRVHSSSYSTTRPELYSLVDIQGTLHKGFLGLRLEGVPIVAPSLWPRGGEELLDELDILLRPGDHLLISGPNGAGKSSIARVLAGLWPTYRGLVSRPRMTSNAGITGTEGGVMFLPQRPYLAQGTLRDQVIYPHTEADMKAAGVKDEDLLPVLEKVKLAYLPTREGGWDTKKEWKDVLSGGEKQRISLARIVYHSPAFAVLDEPTSAVSSDVEGLLYEVCKKQGITIVTLSTRVSLRKYHTFELALDGNHGWAMDRIGAVQERDVAERELEVLKARLAATEEKRRRLEEVKTELGRVWVHGGELDSDISEEVAGELAESFVTEVLGRDGEMGESLYADVPEEKEGDEKEEEVKKEQKEEEKHAEAVVEQSPGTSVMGESYADVTASRTAESFTDVSMMQSRLGESVVTAEVKEGESFADAVKKEE